MTVVQSKLLRDMCWCAYLGLWPGRIRTPNCAQLTSERVKFKTMASRRPVNTQLQLINELQVGVRSKSSSGVETHNNPTTLKMAKSHSVVIACRKTSTLTNDSLATAEKSAQSLLKQWARGSCADLPSLLDSSKSIELQMRFDFLLLDEILVFQIEETVV